MSTQFVHARLSSPRSIRLLTLLPSARFDSPIRCDLQEVSLDDDVKYEALSYVWGDPGPDHTVLVDGDKTLEVTPSCLEALRYLRAAKWGRRRVLWIDAICIDQRHDGDGSTRERNHQVKMMGDVYSRATRVLAWLGPGEPSTARLFRRLKLIRMLKRICHLDVVKDVAPSMGWRLEIATIVRDPKSPYHWAFKPAYNTVVPLLRHPWWHRVWTLQEQVLAKRCELLCGRCSMPLQEFMPEIDINAAATATAGQFVRVHEARDIVYQHVNSKTVIHSYTARVLFCIAFDLEATFPLDKIYGLYSALKMCGIPLADPDYTKTPSMVFEDVVWAWIKSQNNLVILQLAARPSGFATDCPSWVPPWHLPLDHMPYLRSRQAPGMELRYEGFPTPDNTPCNAFFGQRAPIENSHWKSFIQQMAPMSKVLDPGHKTGTLRLRGWYAGKLEYSRAYWDATRARNKEEVRAIRRDWCLHVYKHDSSRGDESGAAMIEMANTLNYFSGVFGVSRASFSTWFDIMIYPERRAGVTWTSDMAKQASLRDRDFASMVTRLGCSTKNASAFSALLDFERWEGMATYPRHAFCMLDNGIMGWADHWSEPGDEVFLVPGAPSPFVLRRAGGGGSHRLVGAAHICRYEYPDKWSIDETELVDVTLI